MSMGTIVTIVLSVSLLIAGIFFIRQITKTSTSVLDLTDEALKNEMSKLFAQDTTKKVVVFPASREIAIKKGEDGGFGFSIRNTGNIDSSFSYTIDVVEIGQGCQLTEQEAKELIVLGKSGAEIVVTSGDILENPIRVKFSVPDITPLCNIRYGVNVKRGELAYLPTVSVDLEVLSK